MAAAMKKAMKPMKAMKVPMKTKKAMKPMKAMKTQKLGSGEMYVTKIVKGKKVKMYKMANAYHRII